MALKLDDHGFCQLVLLFLVVSLNFEKSLALKCYKCQHTINRPNEDCLEANVDMMDSDECSNDEGCMTQIFLQEDSNEVQILIRGCQGQIEDGCEDNGRNCYYTCPTALCNDKTYEPPTTTEIPEAPTTTPVPVECFACGYAGGEDTDHCKVVNTETRKVKCPSGNCSAIVQFPADDLVNLMSLTRSCVKNPYKSYCQKISDQLNCGTFCTGHVCNSNPYWVLPEVGDNGNDPCNAVPVECFACGYVADAGDEHNDHCKVVNTRTRKVTCDSGNCGTIVQFTAGDPMTSTLMSMTRGCVRNPFKSYCVKFSDQLNCGTFCTGHVCNNDPY